MNAARLQAYGKQNTKNKACSICFNRHLKIFHRTKHKKTARLAGSFQARSQPLHWEISFTFNFPMQRLGKRFVHEIGDDCTNGTTQKIEGQYSQRQIVIVESFSGYFGIQRIYHTDYCFHTVGFGVERN